MEVLKAERVDLECNLCHFVAVADLLIRRPHLVKSRRKLIAGAVILSQDRCDFCQDGLGFGQSIREKYQAGSLKIERQNFAAEELDYSLNSVIFRDLIYKGGLSLERTECVVWRTLEDQGLCHLDVVPLQEDLLEKEELCYTKCHYSLTFSAVDHTLILKVDKRCLEGNENK